MKKLYHRNKFGEEYFIAEIEPFDCLIVDYLYEHPKAVCFTNGIIENDITIWEMPSHSDWLIVREE
jgi:hypothetical protein